MPDNFLPAAEVVGYSLQEHASRHVMVSTKANAALQLLFSMGLVHKDECTVVFPSTSASGHTSTSELVQQMMRIKSCMKEGKTLILVKARHLYESLLDALNVHYQKDRGGSIEHNLHRTMLSMAGVTQSVFVQPSFRCILLEDQQELKSSVLPPMINRFSKTTITYTSSLNRLQRRSKATILQKCLVNVPSTGKVANILQFLVPGFTEESLDSACYYFEDADEVIERLCYCFSCKNLRRLELKLIEGLDTDTASIQIDEWRYFWNSYKCSSDFQSVAKQALEGRQHLMVITEQLQLAESSLVETFQKVFATVDPNDHQKFTLANVYPKQITVLNQATSIDVHNSLTTLAGVKEGQAISLFVLDSTSSTQSVLLDSFMYSVSTVPGLDAKRHHVVLVVNVADTLSSSSSQQTALHHL